MIDHKEGCQVVSAEGKCTCGAYRARCARKHDPQPYVISSTAALGSTFAPREKYCQDRAHYGGES